MPSQDMHLSHDDVTRMIHENIERVMRGATDMPRGLNIRVQEDAEWLATLNREQHILEERIRNEQTITDRPGDRGWHSSTCSPLPSTTDLDVEPVDGTNGSDTVPIPERTIFTAMGDAPSGIIDFGSGGVEGSSGVTVNTGNMYYREFTHIPEDAPWYTNWNGDPNQRIRYSIDPATSTHTVTVDRPPFPPDMEQPVQRPNELILSDDPVEQYHLTAISFFKGVKAPSGGVNRYGRTYRELKDTIISSLQGDLDQYRSRTQPGMPEETRERPARGRTR